MRFNSIRFKISILYTTILGIILIVYSTFLYLSLHYTLYDELDNELNKKAQEIAATIDSYLDIIGYDQRTFVFAVKKVIGLGGEHLGEAGTEELERQWSQKIDKLDLKEDQINFLDRTGNSLIRSVNLQEDFPALTSKDKKGLGEGVPVFKSIKFEKRNLRMISFPFPYEDGGQYIIQICTSLKPIIHLLKVRLMHIAVSIPVVLVLASLFGRVFASRILRPVMEITKTASRITHEDLSSRVKAEHIDVEMRYLVDSFNDMISRLEKSFRYIAEFSSHVAHELKTPLAIIRGESELVLRKDRDLEEYKRVIQVNLEEAGRMLKIIEDLLLLTKIDYRPEIFKFRKFDLVEFINDIYEQTKILASRRNIAVNIDMPRRRLNISADRLHLRRLFFNLIDNAIKFTPRDGRIEIVLTDKDRDAVISITDTGAGIPPEDLPKVFDRFFHVDRTEQDAGTSVGLGLSIAQSIAKIHRGKIEVKSHPGRGSTFNVTLPLS